MGQITVVGLGPGSFGALTQETLHILKGGGDIFLRTTKHPVVKLLQEQGLLKAHSFDYLYDTHDNFESIYREIAVALVNKAATTSIVYAVPGHPLVAEESVVQLRELCQERGVSVKVVPAMSFLDPFINAVGYDPIKGLNIVDALQLDKQPLQTAVANVIVQVYSPLVAQDVKISLMDYYPDEHPITIVRAAGVEGEEQVHHGPLYELDRLDWIDYLTTVFLPPLESSKGQAKYPMDPLVDIMGRLRAPDGCPWDREQNHQSLKKYLIEETYEVLDAIDEGNMHKVCEELGDLLLQIAFHAQIASEAGFFDMNDVVAEITEKLVRRHPHVFGDIEVADSNEVSVNWDKIKEQEKQGRGESQSLLDNIPKALPALLKAEKVQKRAAKVGFDWPDYLGAMEKVKEETVELEEAIAEEPIDRVKDEMGDLFFALVNLARLLKVDPESVLAGTVDKFTKRFRFMEQKATETGIELSNLTLEQLDKLWEEAKIALKSAKY